MWGVGPATKAQLAAAGVATIGELAQTSPQTLQRLLGRAIGRKLTALAWNADPRSIEVHARAHSAGAQSALGRQPAAERVYRPVLLHLADRVARRLRAKNRPCRTVTVRVRFADLSSVTRALTLPAPISATTTLMEIAVDLVRGVLADHAGERTISLLAICGSNLGEDPHPQLELPFRLADDGRRPGARKGMARLRADLAMDAIRKRFGDAAVAYASAPPAAAGSVPDDFRTLAEKAL
jgi:DNA polymerase-4